MTLNCLRASRSEPRGLPRPSVADRLRNDRKSGDSRRCLDPFRGNRREFIPFVVSSNTWINVQRSVGNPKDLPSTEARNLRSSKLMHVRVLHRASSVGSCGSSAAKNWLSMDIERRWNEHGSFSGYSDNDSRLLSQRELGTSSFPRRALYRGTTTRRRSNEDTRSEVSISNLAGTNETAALVIPKNTMNLILIDSEGREKERRSIGDPS